MEHPDNCKLLPSFYWPNLRSHIGTFARLLGWDDSPFRFTFCILVDAATADFHCPRRQIETFRRMGIGNFLGRTFWVRALLDTHRRLTLLLR